jgi:hypothetical protein
MMINLPALSNEQFWLLIALLYVCACAESGNLYEPNQLDNTAAQGVTLADSLMGAFNARFLGMANTSGGSSGPQSVQASTTSSPMPSVSDLLDQIAQRAGIPTPPPSAQTPRPAAPRR